MEKVATPPRRVGLNEIPKVKCLSGTQLMSVTLVATKEILVNEV